MDFKYPYTDFHELNLDWFLAEFKKLTEEWLQVQQDWADEQQAYQDLHDYVENYFANLDLYQEVHDILWSPEMRANIQIILSSLTTNMLPSVVADQITNVVASQLSTVVSLQLPGVVHTELPNVLPGVVAGEASDWLAAHVDPNSGYAIDNTLTISRAAADARTAGDHFNNINAALDYLGDKVGTEAVSITEADLTDYALHQGALGSNGNWSSVNSNFQYIVIPVPCKGCHIDYHVSSASPRSDITWCGLNTYYDAIEGEPYDVDDVLGRRTSNSANYDIPDDVHYLVFCMVWGGDTVIFNDFSIHKPETVGSVTQDVADLKTIVDKPGVKMLILGDSYSANPNIYVNYLQAHMNITDLVNLSVTSAHLKDIYADRITYPYDGRPVYNGTGNNNTFSNQIEKLKRLKAGIDLDPGETPIYQTTDEFPDVILIVGGKNDTVDADTDGYEDEMWQKVHAYSYVSDGSVALTDTYLPVNYENTDRTNFAGEMHYIYGALRAIFQDIKIFFVTPSGINYSNADHTAYMIKSDQIRKAARFLCVPTINWDLEGRLSYVDNRVLGTGTSADPYTRNASSRYTVDSLHPNWLGGEFLGAVILAELRKYGIIN